MNAHNKRNHVPSFNGIRLIQAHVNQRAVIECYVNGFSKMKPVVPTDCQANCSLSQCLHGGDGDLQWLDIKQANRVCKSCEQFQEAASQAVMLVGINRADLAQEALQEGGLFKTASAHFQEGIATLHVSSWRLEEDLHEGR